MLYAGIPMPQYVMIALQQHCIKVSEAADKGIGMHSLTHGLLR